VHITTPDPFIPGFGDQLIGATAGEHRTVNVDFPAEFVSPQLAGKKGVYAVDVLTVKEKTIPELSEEFAKSYGAESLEKLQEGVRHDLGNELAFKQRRSVRNQLVRWLLERAQFELPESVVMGETKNVIYDIVRENQQRGVPKEAIDQQRDEIYNVASNSAKDRVRAAFILGKIAEQEQIKVNDQEMAQRIVTLAEQNHVKPDKLIKQLRERNGLAEIHEQILSSKVLDFLQLNAKIEEIQSPPGPSFV
jgi:trigger factor